MGQNRLRIEMKIGFAILPEKSFLENIVNVENEIHDEFGFFDRLGTKHNLPHVTLFQGDMDESLDYGQTAERIAEKIRETVPERGLDFLDVVYEPYGWYFWQCFKTPELSGLHGFVLSLVKGHIILDPDRMDDIPEGICDIQKRGILDYGYRYAGEAFLPHATVGRADGQDEEMLKILNVLFQPQKTYIERVSVYRMGDNGTHKDTLYEVNL